MHNVDVFHCPDVTEDVDESMPLSNNAKTLIEKVMPALSEPFAHYSMRPGWKYVTKLRPRS
jgi:hypothetical protein